MSRTIRVLSGYALLSAVLLHAPFAHAISPNAYLNGTYGCTNLAVQANKNASAPPTFTDTWDDTGTVTFDGVSSFTILGGNDNDIGKLSSNPSAPGNYTIAPDGAVTVTNSNSSTLEGWASADGNTVVLANMTAVASGSPAHLQMLACVREDTIALLNTASGVGALASNSTGYNNSAVGTLSLNANVTGYYNNAVGYGAMATNTTGYNNNAQGSYALSANTVGYGNSAMGANSFVNMVDGCRNVGVGNNTGTALINTGLTAPPYDCYNTYIGWGVAGTDGDSGVTRIGNPTYATATYLAGVYGASAGGNYVCVSSSGQLSSGATCAAVSSERYKEDIHPVADTERLMALAPVSFRYRNADSSGDKPIEYGLIAEQVAEVYPELVVRDAQGRPDAVKYQDLTPLLLKRIQEQQAQLQEQTMKLQQQGDRLQEQSVKLEQQDEKLHDMSELRDRLAALETQMREQLAVRAGSSPAHDQVAVR